MELQTRIEDVTVYADRALVTRVGVMTLEAGTHHVRLVGLPVSLHQDSVRVSGQSAVSAVLHGFDYQTVYTGEAPSERVAQLEQMALALADRARGIEDALAVHRTQLELMRQTAQQAAGGLVHQLSEGKAKLNEWEDLLGFLETRQKAEAGRVLALEQDLRAVASERQKLEAELWNLRSMRVQESGQVTVTVELPAAGEVTLSLDYVVNGASWTPAYDARLSAAGDRLEWRYHGMVSQTTGEHWEDVRLKLSTAQPAEGSHPPVVEPWWLHAYQPPRPRMAAMAAPGGPMRKRGGGGDDEDEMLKEEGYGGMAADMAFEPPMSAPPPAPMNAPPVAVRHEGTSVTLSVARPLTIPSHGEPHQAPIGQADMPVTRRYTVVPKLTPHAFLEVEATHEGPWPILPGPVKAYVGQDYVGTTPLTQDVLSGQRFWLPMGVDRAIQVKRQRLKRFQGEAGMIQKQRTLDYQYEITVSSFKDAAERLRLVEPFPRPSQDEIKVKLGATTPPAKHDEPGQLVWELELPPQAPLTVRWDYRVEHPVAMVVENLE